MNNYLDIKKSFYIHFVNEMNRYSAMPFFYNLFSFGVSAYVVGGFFRDFLLNKKSRDIDVLVDTDIDSLVKFINKNNYIYSINRHNGIKIKIEELEIDVWSIDKNWAFKNNLVTLNENDKLNSIAKGCFYNYDSLVISLNDFSFNTRYFKSFLKNNQLNILQENVAYKALNPSVEANVLRAIYIKKEFNSTFTQSTHCYLLNTIGFLKDNYGDSYKRLNKVKQSYLKYDKITDQDIIDFIISLKNDYTPNNQITLDL